MPPPIRRRRGPDPAGYNIGWTEKWCPRCRRFKPATIEYFWPRSRRDRPRGWSPYCKACCTGRRGLMFYERAQKRKAAALRGATKEEAPA